MNNAGWHAAHAVQHLCRGDFVAAEKLAEVALSYPGFPEYTG